MGVIYRLGMLVPSFAAVGRYLQGTGRVVKRFMEDESEGYLFEVRHAGEKLLYGARTSAVAEGGTWLALTVLICSAVRLDIRRALVANHELAIGALVVAGANVLLRQTLPLDALRAEHLERTIAGMAVTTAMLKAAANLAPGTESTAPFAYAFR